MTLLLDEPAVCRRPVGVVRVAGPDRLAYLHTMLTQHLEDARPGDAADFAYLDPKGNPLAVGRALVAADDVLLVTPDADVAASLTAALEKFRFLTKVEADDVSGGWALASVRGPAPLPGDPPDPMRVVARGEGFAVGDRGGGLDLVGPAGWIAAEASGLGLPEADAEDWEAWRIVHGEPAWGREIRPGHRLQELGLLPTHVHLRKGCYPGQESIAKIYNLGSPRRALFVLEADAEIPVGGHVTSAARAGERWAGMALLPVADGEPQLDGLAARVVRRVGSAPTDGRPA